MILQSLETNNIETVVSELIANSNESLEAIKVVNVANEGQAKQLDATLKNFHDLGLEINSVSEATTMIGEQMAILTNVKNKIIDITESLSATSEENAASTQETSASTQEVSSLIEGCLDDVEKLKELSISLEQNMSVFKL